MIADRQQIKRWHQLLNVREVPLRPIDEINAALSVNKGRHFLTAAVAAAEAIRAGQPVEIPWISPPEPARRPASDGALMAEWVWKAYLRSLSPTTSNDWLIAYAKALSPTALVFTVNDNPEPWWQNEMVILHALHSFAMRSGNAEVLAKTMECADFHLREIQPDHATNEPWSVHAYASHADGNVTAETLWHAAYIQHAGRPGPVASLLARDAASALAAFLQS